MKKSIKLILLSIITICILAGCNRANLSDKKDKALNQSSNTASSNSTPKMTVKEAENLDDGKLFESIKNTDEAVNLNDVDVQDELNSIDDILSDKDPLADIPKNIGIEK